MVTNDRPFLLTPEFRSKVDAGRITNNLLYNKGYDFNNIG